MATSSRRVFKTDRLVPPGEVLAEELAERDMTQTALAQAIGRPLQVINGIIAGRKAVTAETALQLEKALGIPAEFWMNLEVMYRLGRARAKAGEQRARYVLSSRGGGAASAYGLRPLLEAPDPASIVVRRPGTDGAGH